MWFPIYCCRNNDLSSLAELYSFSVDHVAYGEHLTHDLTHRRHLDHQMTISGVDSFFLPRRSAFITHTRPQARWSPHRRYRAEQTRIHKVNYVQHVKARFPLAELTGRVDILSTRLVETRARQHGRC